MLFQFSNVLVFTLVAAGFVFVSLAISRRLRPHVPFREKLLAYECGEVPVEGGRINFNIRFYSFALIFIVFDVELALMLPAGMVFRRWVQEGRGLLALFEIGTFVLILLLGLVYVWVKGDLEWVKKVAGEKRSFGEVVQKASRVP